MKRIADLRTIWKHEAQDFTNWLAEEESLELLGETIGITLDLIEKESSIGSFNADIIASETSTNHKVVIENQLTDSDHDHLGKIITYASGKDASTVVWIVARARDEHAQAISWLNSHTDESIGFFLLEIELWQIDNSLPAPRFNVVERPNDWGKAMKQAEGLTETQRIQLSYWQAYKEQAASNPEFARMFNPQKPSPQHWTDLAIGSSAYHITLRINTQKKRIGVDLYISDDKALFAQVRDKLEEFATENEVAYAFWGEDTKSSGFRIFRERCDIRSNSSKWTEYIAWQLKWAVALRAKLAELGL